MIFLVNNLAFPKKLFIFARILRMIRLSCSSRDGNWQAWKKYNISYGMLKSFIYKRRFEKVYTENYTRLYYYALHIVNDEETAKDILNDVFATLWNNIETVDLAKINAYLVTSVRNRSIDHLRHLVLESQYTDEYLHTAEMFYDDYSDEKDRLVEEMFAHLSPPTDEILRMCYLKRMKYAEVAEQLDISPNTVKKHIMKALKILRELYKR